MQVAETIKYQIINGQSHKGESGTQLIMCWGASRFAAMTNGLCFKVRGLKLKGKVLVMLDESQDLYTIHFYNTKNTLVEIVEGVFAEDLVQIIDTCIESGK